MSAISRVGAGVVIPRAPAGEEDLKEGIKLLQRKNFQDIREVTSLFQKAAEEGNPAAQFYMGLLNLSECNEDIFYFI